MRYILCLSYNGRDFCGWQIQPSAPSVQEALERALSQLLGCPVPVTGAGRTDTSVHASGYIAHFDLSGPLPFPAGDFCYKVNAILPRSVVVHSVTPAPVGDAAGMDGETAGTDGFHARFSARRRSYTYFLHRVKDPFLDAFSWQCGYPGLDFGAMNEACHFLLGTHFFTCFEKTGGNAKTSRCTVHEAFWKPYTPSHIAILGSPRIVMGDAWGDAGAGVSHRSAGNVDAGAGHGLAGNVGSAGTAGRAGATGGRETDIGRASWIHTDYQTVTQSPFPKIGEGTSVKSLIHSTELYESKYWYFRISADRFLRNMVRAIVGSLIEVGRGRQRPEWIRELVMDGTRSDAGESVPGHALFLNRVEY